MMGKYLKTYRVKDSVHANLFIPWTQYKLTGH